MSEKWRISELQSAVDFALSVSEYNGQASARITVVPDTRAIRYYTTLGIVDRAAEMKGRTAFYDRRHVLQLVAIKRLQSTGLSLVEIQDQLTGASNRKLSGLAKLPKDFWESLPEKLSRPQLRIKRKQSSDNQSSGDRDMPPMIRQQQDVAEKDGTVARVEKAFWAENVSAAPFSDLLDRPKIRTETRIEYANGVSITIPISSKVLNEDELQSLAPTIKQLRNKIDELLERSSND